ncbi:MAG: monofunctional biosynthetic peptidoglycan transglycosylase [Bacteroidota bacterium]|nr:monofunctional biosynthetic peptidoglycan transglycosylase [Bacteroidota bacterium]
MIKKIIRIVLKIILWFFVSTFAIVIIYRFLPPPITPLMVIRLFEQAIDENRDMRLYKDWVAIDDMSPAMPLAVITSEDQRFEEHYGFDIEAIEKARKYNVRHKGKKVKGASTISQQTAKNVFLWPDRSYVRKGFEVYFTALIELLWSKERIIEVYLNVIEMGDGVYGAEAASQQYFDKPVSKINNGQAALIAACLPNPLRWSPSKPTPYIKRKQSWILRHMRMAEKPGFNK